MCISSIMSKDQRRIEEAQTNEMARGYHYPGAFEDSIGPVDSPKRCIEPALELASPKKEEI